MALLSPSILSADFLRLGEEVQAVERAGVPYLHIDVMDGVFVPSISFGMPILQAVSKQTTLFMDVHLMIVNPERYIETFVKCGADGITIHVEACESIMETLQAIRALGVKAGISLNPETPVEAVLPYLEYVDLCLVMTVNPGFGGQTYIDSCTEKIRQIRDVIVERNLAVQIEVDGGVKEENVTVVLEAGADVVVSGSGVFGTETEQKTRRMKATMDEIARKVWR